MRQNNNEEFYQWLVDKARTGWISIKVPSHIISPHQCDGTPKDGAEFRLTIDNLVQCKSCQNLLELPVGVLESVQTYSCFSHSKMKR